MIARSSRSRSLAFRAGCSCAIRRSANSTDPTRCAQPGAVETRHGTTHPEQDTGVQPQHVDAVENHAGRSAGDFDRRCRAWAVVPRRITRARRHEDENTSGREGDCRHEQPQPRPPTYWRRNSLYSVPHPSTHLDPPAWDEPRVSCPPRNELSPGAYPTVCQPLTCVCFDVRHIHWKRVELAGLRSPTACARIGP